MEKGKIIFLNGVSSSGKTTLAKFLQEQLPEPFFHLSGDMFCNAVSNKYWKTDPLSICLKALSGFHHTIKTFSDLGFNVIADTVLQNNLNSLDECIALLHNHPVLFVHVTCPVDELRRREKIRGDREIGQAEIQLPILDPQDTYDITVDTYNLSVEECSERIMELLKCPDKFTAFKALRAQQNKCTVVNI
jgi:chloramphenicol 3-O-phosphotransferase